MSKIKLQEFVEIGRLFEVYGNLLSDDRQKIMVEYFEYNMTLVEIAEEKGISRQAVLDSIDKSCERLKEYEKALHIIEKNEKLSKELVEIQSIAIKNSQNEIKEKVDKILKDI